MRHLFIVVIGIFFLVGCSTQESFGDPITAGEPTPIPTAIVPSRPVYQVEQGDIIDERSFFGRVSPVFSEPLQFPQDGRVIVTHFNRGDTVSAGDVIAELDTSALEQALLTTQADLEIAESLLANVENQVAFETQRAQLNLNLAQLELDNALSNASNPPTSNEQFEISRLEILRDLAQLLVDEVNSVVDPQLQVDVTRARQAVVAIEQTITEMILVAPIDGTITSLQIEVGDMVEAFNTIGLVADETDLEVRDTLSPDILEELSEGMPAQLSIDTRAGVETDGILLTIPDPYGTGDDEFIHVRFNDPEAAATLFENGERVTISIIVNQREDVLWLPINALREFNGRNFVVVEEDNAQRRVDVELGIEGNGRVEIISGVELGQTVIGQ